MASRAALPKARMIVTPNGDGCALAARTLQVPSQAFFDLFFASCGKFLLKQQQQQQHALVLAVPDASTRCSQTTSHCSAVSAANPVRTLLCGLWDMLSCGLCGALPAVPAAADGVPSGERGTTQRSVQPALVSCIRGRDDVEMLTFMHGVRPMLLALEVLGAWTYIAVREIKSNLSKIEETVAKGKLADEWLLSAMLDNEISSGVHGAGGLVASGSAAEGVLWLYRFLRLWSELWREPRPSTFKQALDAAYKASVGPFHGWMLQRTFSIAISVVPTWAEAHDRLEAFDIDGEAGLMRSIAALDPVLDRMEAALRSRDLWDVRQN